MPGCLKPTPKPAQQLATQSSLPTLGIFSYRWAFWKFRSKSPRAANSAGETHPKEMWARWWRHPAPTIDATSGDTDPTCVRRYASYDAGGRRQ